MEESQTKSYYHSHLCSEYDKKCKVFVLLNNVIYQTTEYDFKKIITDNLSDDVSKGNNSCGIPESGVYFFTLLQLLNPPPLIER